MRNQGNIHRVQLIQFPLAENDLISCIVRIPSRVSVGAGACAQGCRRVGREMDHPQREKEDDKNENQ